MKAILPSETELVGHWIVTPEGLQPDEVSKRIADLIVAHLIELATDESGWNILYVDPTDQRYWELSYPASDSHGGGPPRLRALSMEEASSRYGQNIHWQASS